MKSKIKKISLIIIVSTLLSSVAALFSLFIVNTDKKVKIQSSNDELGIDKYLSERKNILGLIKNNDNEIIFDDFLIKINLKKIILCAITQTIYFKMNNFKINDINLKINYKLNSDKELIMNIEYNFSNISKKYKPIFMLEIIE